MSKLFPPSRPRSDNRGEQLVYDALAKGGLPKDWWAWNGLRLRAAKTDAAEPGDPRRRAPVQGSAVKSEAEGDFVFYVPKRGVILLEVKGGRIECRGGHWQQNGRAFDRAPRDQAHELSRVLRGALCARSGRAPGDVPPFTIGTCFPETAFTTSPTHGDLHNVVIGAHELPYLRERLDSLANELLVRPWQGDDTWVRDGIHALWGETWVPSLSAGKRVALREHELVALDAAQLHVLDAVSENPRMFVHGGAGTGKTLLVREVARRRKAEGANAVVLCWTRALAASLREDGLDAAGVRDFALSLVRRADLEPAVPGNPAQFRDDDWDLVVVQAETEALPLLGRVADTVIVDEAQDFRPADWDFVRALAPEWLWAFGDDAQSFWSDRTMPSDLGLMRYRLQVPYRCPPAIQAFVDAHRANATVMPERDDAVRLVEADDAASAVGRELARLLTQGVAPEDIAILTLSGRDSSALVRADSIGDTPVVPADDPRAHTHVVLDTFLRFKGLERPYVIVAELDKVRSGYDVRMHIAASRATVGLVVVATKEKVGADRRLAVLAAKREAEA